MRRPHPLLVALALSLALPAGCRSYRASGTEDRPFHKLVPAYVVLGRKDFTVDVDGSLVLIRPAARRKILELVGAGDGFEVREQ
jgi:hypothetical protein